MKAPRLSTGQESTLGVWHELCVQHFGADSPATAFVAEKIAEQGEDEPVLANESQFLMALMAKNEAGA